MGYETRILAASQMGEIKAAVDGFNDGSIAYIIVHKFSPTCYITEYVDSDKLRVIINYQIKNADSFLMRSTIRKYKQESDEVHIITLCDDRERNLISEIEANVINQQMESLPSDFGKNLSKNVSPIFALVEAEEVKEARKSKSALNPNVQEFKPSAS